MSADKPEGAGPAIISDHRFVPRVRRLGSERAATRHWWDLCEKCNLGEAAHQETVRPRDCGVVNTVGDRVYVCHNMPGHGGRHEGTDEYGTVSWPSA